MWILFKHSIIFEEMELPQRPCDQLSTFVVEPNLAIPSDNVCKQLQRSSMTMRPNFFDEADISLFDMFQRKAIRHSIREFEINCWGSSNNFLHTCYHIPTHLLGASGNKEKLNPFRFSHSAHWELPKWRNSPSPICAKIYIPWKDQLAPAILTNVPSTDSKCVRKHIDDPKIILSDKKKS